MCRAAVRLAVLFALASGGCATTTGRLTRDVIQPLGADDVAGASYRDALVREARQRGLSRRTAWQRLGHWRPDLLFGVTSQADGPNFFLAANGETDPQAELDATLRGFFATLPAETADVQHPICQFPARFRWLDEQLHFDRARLAVPACPRYDEFRTQTDAASLSFVFSSYYLNNPASVFGHTFVRIVKRGKPGDVEHHELLDRAIEFSATVDTQNALIYGFKGIFGMFPGTFRNVPYYFKVRQYNDFEARDIYEYELSFTPAEVEMFVAHLWELGSTFFDYFYVSENCSYHLLGALEVVRPSLELLREMHWPVIPADTIKALYANDLVGAVKFRPSLRRIFRTRIAGMPESDRDLVEELGANGAAPVPADLPPERKIRAFDAAQDLVDILHAKKLTYEVDSEPARRKQQLLERRAEVLVPSEDLAVAVPWRSMPQLGHHSRRAGVGFAIDDGGAQAYQLDARLALHDLADPVAGYPELSQLEFFPIRARVRLDNAGEGDRFQLDSVSLVRIVSLTPQDRFDRKLSWKVDLGMIRLDDEGCDACQVGRLVVGTGAALATSGLGVIGFATMDLHLLSGPGLDGIEGIPLRAGAGPALGLRLRLAPRLVSLTTGELIWLPTQDPTFTWQARSILRLAMGPIFALNAEAQLDQERAIAQLSALVYF